MLNWINEIFSFLTFINSFTVQHQCYTSMASLSWAAEQPKAHIYFSKNMNILHDYVCIYFVCVFYLQLVNHCITAVIRNWKCATCWNIGLLCKTLTNFILCVHAAPQQVYTVGPSGTSLLMWAATGNHGNHWTYANVILSNAAPFRVIFQAEVGGDMWTDIALDDVSYTTECMTGGKHVFVLLLFHPCFLLVALYSFFMLFL